MSQNYMTINIKQHPLCPDPEKRSQMKCIVMNLSNVLLASLILVATITTSAQSQSTPQARADGKRLYEINCANCHGNAAQGAVKAGIEISIITERGGKQPPNLTDQAWDHGSTDAEIFALIKKGFSSGMMPPFGCRDPKGNVVCPCSRIASGYDSRRHNSTADNCSGSS